VYSAADYVQAQRVRSLLKREVMAAMDDLDVLVMPTAIGTAPTFEGYDPDALLKSPSFMAIWNLTGQPAASICCGFTAESGLPIGMQVVGKPFADVSVLRVSDAYQQITDWHTRAPALALEVA
jgi:aspartyl-tRNA(Asn)/glutamyl-tRNA(Gln) amidotransferase subunit A